MRWFYGWNVIAVALFFQGVTSGAALGSFTLFVLPWMNEFGGSRGEILMVSFATTIGMAAVTPFVGRLLDTRSIRVLVCVGVLLFGAGFALLGLTTELWQVFVVYGGIVSVGLSLAGPVTAQTLAARWFRARRGLAIGWAVLGSNIGGFALPPVVIFLMRELGWAKHPLLNCRRVDSHAASPRLARHPELAGGEGGSARAGRSHQ